MIRLMIRVVMLLFVLTPPATAQQTIMNIPSADIMDRGSLLIRFDQGFYSEAYQLQPNIIIGLGRGLETSVDVESINSNRLLSIIATGIKYRFYNKKRLSLYIGDKVYFPNAKNYFYIAAAYQVVGFRFTTGSWNLQNNSNHTGTLIGIERPLSVNKLTITPAADWQNGKDFNGYVTAGVMFITKHWLVTPAYQHRNYGTQGGILYVGYFL